MGCFPSHRHNKINGVSNEENESPEKTNKSSLKKSYNVPLEEQNGNKNTNLKIVKTKQSIQCENEKSNDISIKKKISSINNFKLTQGLLVGNSGTDPYKEYEKLEILGEGSFGIVFKVVHKKLKLIRAMKIIDKKSAALDHETEKSLINEINILKTLDHPNIIKVYEYYNTENKLYIISELCTGGELFDKIHKEKSFSERVAGHIMKQIFSAVNFCHNNKVIHRDLKPENILIETQKEEKKEFFHIKIIDFGTSDVIKKNKMFSMQIGTPYYIAPEILEGSYNEKCDLWSCGVIMYILLCGYPPFYAEEDKDIYKAVKSGKYSIIGKEWDNVSLEAKDLINNLLKKDISNRYSAEKALAHNWIRKNEKLSKEEYKISDEKILNVAENLKVFNANKKLQQATLAYIVHNMLKREETEEFRKIFIQFDLNGDGRLTKEELITGLNKVMTPEEAKAEVEKIIKIVDVDGNGFIEYEEFLRAAMDKERILSEKNLQNVFTFFDKDKSGKISINEIRKLLGGSGEIKITDEVWTQVVSEMDSNGDGEVEFKEFKDMMNKLVDCKDLLKIKKNEV